MSVEFDCNCVGFALYKVGLLPSERYVIPKPITHFEGLVETTSDDAQLLAVVVDDFPVVHMAAIDPDDRNFVFDRAGFNKPKRRVRISDCLDPYNIRESGPTVVYLKKK